MGREACGAGKHLEGSVYRALAPDRLPRAPCDLVAADKTIPQSLFWAVEGPRGAPWHPLIASCETNPREQAEGDMSLTERRSWFEGTNQKPSAQETSIYTESHVSDGCGSARGTPSQTDLLILFLKSPAPYNTAKKPQEKKSSGGNH